MSGNPRGHRRSRRSPPRAKSSHASPRSAPAVALEFKPFVESEGRLEPVPHVLPFFAPWARAQCTHRFGLSNPFLANEEVSLASARATPAGFCKSFSSNWSRSSVSRTFQAVSRDDARARACPPVPKCTRLVPAKDPTLAIAGNTTKHPHLQGFSASPHPDSNRRPPPYPGGSRPSRAYTRDH
jgi:hypothetical protein